MQTQPGGMGLPDMRRPPPQPEMPFPTPYGPDTGNTEHVPDIGERGDPTARKSPHDPAPDVTDDFVPDLEERIIPQPKPGLKRRKDEPRQGPSDDRRPHPSRTH